jgi:hypothetical protein
MAVLVSMTLMLATLVQIPAMNSVVFAGGGNGDDDDGRSHGCPEGEQGDQSSNGKCFHGDRHDDDEHDDD